MRAIKLYKSLFLLTVFVVIVNCKGGTHSLNNPKPSEIPLKDTIGFTILLNGSHGNFKENRRNVIVSSEALQEVYNTINSTRKPSLPVPVIDFSNYQVGLVCTGELSHGGTSVKLRYIEKTSENIIVHLGGDSPLPGENATTVLTTPFILFKFKKQTLPVLFKYPFEE